MIETSIDRESLKAAVWYTVAQIVQEEEIDLQRSATEPFVASLTELVYLQAEHLALELRAFASHAGRSTIREEDVILVARKSKPLQQLLSEEAQRYKSASASDSMNSVTKPKALKSKPGT